MKKFFLGIGMFINSFLIVLFLRLEVNYEISNFEKSGADNMISVLFLEMLIPVLSIIPFIVDIIITILVCTYVKHNKIELTVFNINKTLDVLQLITFLIIVLCAINFILAGNWSGVILSVFIISQLYLYIIWCWNIYQSRKSIN